MPIKPEELSEAFEYAYGAKPDEIESIVKAKELFTAHAVLRDQAHKDEAIVGKVFGGAETKLKSAFKDVLGDDNSETRTKFTQAKTFTEKIDVLHGAITGKYSQEIDELKKKVGAGSPELKAEYENKISDITTRYEAEKQARQEAINGLKDWEQKFQKREEEFKINQLLKDVREKVEIDPTLGTTQQGKLIMKGFERDFFDKYQPTLGDDGNSLIFLEKATGKPVSNPKRAGDFLPATEVFAMAIKDAGIEKKSPAAGQRVPAGQFYQQPAQSQGGQGQQKQRPMRRMIP